MGILGTEIIWPYWNIIYSPPLSVFHNAVSISIPTICTVSVIARRLDRQIWSGLCLNFIIVLLDFEVEHLAVCEIVTAWASSPRAGIKALDRCWQINLFWYIGCRQREWNNKLFFLNTYDVNNHFPCDTFDLLWLDWELQIVLCVYDLFHMLVLGGQKR